MVSSIIGVCVLVVTWRWAYAEDPCIEGGYSLLPRADYRGGGCEYNADKQTCDATLRPGWYRAIGRAGNLKLQELEADIFTCGTKFPIWLDGTHPSSTEGEVERTLRQVITEKTWPIRVKNCQNEYYVYKLEPTATCPEAYCFGVNATDPCPPFDPCDIYEYQYVSYDPERSGICTDSETNNCNPSQESFTSPWVVFRDSDQGFLNVSNTPLDVGACGSFSPMWIKEIVSTDAEDITTQKLCIASEYDNCATESTIRSKHCSWFDVYEVPVNISCGRLCLDDPGASCAAKASDPCDESVYRELPRAEYRGGACDYDDQKPTCDAALYSDWYRAIGVNGSLKMQDTPAELFTCGTKFPIWMNGSHPSPPDGEVEVTLLQAGSDEEVVAKVKNCNDEFFVYMLKPTESCPEAYCFGLTDSDSCPPFDPCDIYEHTVVKYDAGRSSACSATPVDGCIAESFSLPWVAFQDSNGGFLNVSRSTPGIGACGSRSPMWIKETLSTDAYGISTETVCIETPDSPCGPEITMRSKKCKWFTVYEPPVNVECSRLCLDDPQPICPVESTDDHETHQPRDVNNDDDDHSSKQHLWIVAAVLSFVIAIAGIVAACIIYRYRKHWPSSRSQKAKAYRIRVASAGAQSEKQRMSIATVNSQSSVVLS